MKNMNPITIYEQLDSIRMTPVKRLEAEAALRRGEVIANLIHGAGRLVRRGAAGATRACRRAVRAHLRLHEEIYRGRCSSYSGHSRPLRTARQVI
jgi:hypothetical protein